MVSPCSFFHPRWSGLKDSCDVEMVQTAKSRNELFLGLDSPGKGGNFDDCKGRLRGLFDQILSLFSRNISVNECIRPTPLLLGDGQPADLFELFLVVTQRGGYDEVSESSLWDLVAEECGLSSGFVASVKLIYAKHLKELDQWLWQIFRDGSLLSGKNGDIKKLDLLPLELETEFRSLLLGGQEKLIQLELTRNGENIDLDGSPNELHLSNGRNINKMHDNVKRFMNSSDKNGFFLVDDDVTSSTDDAVKEAMDKVHENEEKINIDDDEKSCVEDDNSIAIASKRVVEKMVCPRKRKQELPTFSGMLNWVSEVAKHSDDPVIGIIPECSRAELFWIQTLLVREALLIRKQNTKESVTPKKLRMHPSMYEDNDALNHRCTERIRCSKRLPSSPKSHPCPCCQLQKEKPTPSKVTSPWKAEEMNSPKETVLVTVEILATDNKDKVSSDEPLRKQVSVGPRFQAEVPEWTGAVFESDSKWLGMRMWPPENVENSSLVERDCIGEGRPNSCDCQFPGSIECVRFHIAEKRKNLRSEVGLLFFHWRFDRMGEEVSLSWTIKEEKKFKEMVMLHPTSLNASSNGALRFFPTKTRKKLISYYFNVFLIQRRSYQNRATPEDIDSDDDEKPCGSVGYRFGHQAIHVPGTRSLMCTQNEQCTDVD